MHAALYVSFGSNSFYFFWHRILKKRTKNIKQQKTSCCENKSTFATVLINFKMRPPFCNTTFINVEVLASVARECHQAPRTRSRRLLRLTTSSIAPTTVSAPVTLLCSESLLLTHLLHSCSRPTPSLICKFQDAN